MSDIQQFIPASGGMILVKTTEQTESVYVKYDDHISDKSRALIRCSDNWHEREKKLQAQIDHLLYLIEELHLAGDELDMTLDHHRVGGESSNKWCAVSNKVSSYYQSLGKNLYDYKYLVLKMEAKDEK